MSAGDEARSVAGIRLTHPDRVMYPQQGVTKLDLATYLEAAAERLEYYACGRLISLVRCPQGRAKACFFQRHGDGMPEELKQLRIEKKDADGKPYIYATDVTGLIAAVQMGTLEFHIWGSRVDAVEKPDRIVFDLDPDPSVDFAAVKEAAGELRQVLEALDMQSFPMLTGGKGIHVVIPITRRHEWPTVKAFSAGVSQRLAEAAPKRYVATMSKAKRKGRIFIDYFRNDRSSTAIAPYSPRAREGAPVAWPVTWDELAKVEAANEVSLPEAVKRLKRADPWQDYASIRQGLKASALKAVGVD